MNIEGNWFTEACPHTGTGFSLRIEGRVHEEQTPFQRLEIFKTTDFGYLMTLDGATMVSTRDNFLYHEMMSHPVLFSHPHPRRVAIIGGGDCGTLREVLRHPEVEHATQIDIDERVTRVAEQYFPELCESNGDPRAELLFIDGIDWMNKAAPGSLDVIIVDSTDPVGPGEVLFSAEFFRACHNALAEGGMIVQQSESALIHLPIIQRMYDSMRDAGFSDRKTLFFPQCIYPSGWWSATMARKGATIAGFREADAAAKPFETQYYNVDIHRAALAEPEFFRRGLVR